MGVIAAAVIGAVAVGGAAVAASNSQRSAANKAADASRDSNATTLRLYDLARGSEGSAIYPVYGTDAEKAVFAAAQNDFKASQAAMGSPADQLAWYQSGLAPQRAQFDAGVQQVGDIYSGAMTARQIANNAPVAAARTAAAAGQKTSLLQAAQESLNRMKAGHPGEFGTFAQKMQLNALAPGLQAAANVTGQANEQNALDMQAIQNMRDTLGLQYLNQPLTSAQQAVSMRLMPTQAVGQAFNASVAPLNMFNIGVGHPPTIPPLPTPGPIPGWGQIAAAGVGSLATTAGNYYANQKFAQQLAANQNAYNGYRAPGFYNQATAPIPTWDSNRYYNTYGSGGSGGYNPGSDIYAAGDMMGG